MRTGDPASLNNSNFPAFEDALWAALGRRRARVLLGGALRALRELAEGLLGPISAAQQALRDSTGAKLDELEAEARQRRDELALLADDSSWERELNAELQTARERVDMLARRELEKNWTRFLTEYVHDSRLLGNLEELRAQADADTAALLGAVLKLVRKQVAAAMERFSVAKRISLTPPPISDLPDLPPPEVAGDITALNRGKDDGEWLKMRNTSIGVTLGATGGGAAGAAIGALLGTFIFPGVGTLAGAGLGASWGSLVLGSIGSLGGGIFGFRNGVRAQEARNADSLRAELVRLFNSHKAAQADYLHKLIKQAVDETRPVVIAELRSRLAQQREIINQILLRLAEERRAVKTGHAADDAKIAAERKPLDDLLGDVDGLAGETDLLAGQPPADAGDDPDAKA